jgi:hypothetical protein
MRSLILGVAIGSGNAIEKFSVLKTHCKILNNKVANKKHSAP